MSVCRVLSLCVAIASIASAQTWNEMTNGGGDAPSLPPGQITAGNGALVTLGGTISNPDLDVDLFCIKITDHSSFSATITEVNQGMQPELWLFDSAGMGVAHASDAILPYSVTITNALVPVNGIYFLGISRPGAQPFDGANNPIFPTIGHGETGPNLAVGPVASWGTGSGVPGAYAIQLKGASYHQPPVGGGGGPCWTYTNETHFSLGNLFNLEVVKDPGTGEECLRLKDNVKAWPYVAIANSNRGTLVRIAVENMPAYGIGEGDVLGEYKTAPAGMNTSPSRTTVDGYGNIWVGNRNEAGFSNGQFKGSVTRIGLTVGGTRTDQFGNPNPTGQYLKGPFQYCSCEDRDGDGLIRTSLGYPHTTGAPNADYVPTELQWPNTAGADTDGGVSTAEDECITAYVRTEGTNVRHVSIDGNNNIWVGGTGNREFELLDGSLATQVGGTAFQSTCGGYGGLVDPYGVVWSAHWGGNNLMRYDPSGPTLNCLNIPNYGLGLDPATCHIWTTSALIDNNSREVSSAGLLLNTYAHTTSIPNLVPRGTVVHNGSVWVAHSSSNTLGRLSTGGALCGSVTLLEPSNNVSGTTPHGVAVDTNDKIWSANNASNNAMRIDPSIGACGGVDLAVDLGAAPNIAAGPYNYSDMTGRLLLTVAPQGSWTFIHDGGAPGCKWGTLSWLATLTSGASIQVRVRASDSPIPSGPWTVVGNNVPFTGVVGQYLQVQITLKRNIVDCKPVGEALLCELTICKESECTVEVESLVCKPGTPYGLDITLTVNNNTGVTAEKILITPLPIGGPISFVPNSIIQTIPNGGQFTFTTTAFGWTSGQPFCFLVTLLDKTNKACCTSEVCVTPECDCFQIVKEQVVCDPLTGTFNYTFQFQNLTNQPISHVYFFPQGGAVFTPNYIGFGTPVPPNGFSPPISVTISGAAPGSKVCFEMTLHDEPLHQCCGRLHCITLPDCLSGGGGPGGGNNPQWAHFDAGLASACVTTGTLSIINNSTEPRAFKWQITPGEDVGCNFPIPPGAISPSSGETAPLSPGKCVDIPIEIQTGMLPENGIGCLKVVLVQEEIGFSLKTGGMVLGPKLFNDGQPTGAVAVCSAEPPAVIGLTLGTPRPMAFVLTNTGTAQTTFQYEILSSGPFLSIGGLAPGKALAGTVVVAPGASEQVSFDANLQQDSGARVMDIVCYVRPAGGYPHPLLPAASISARKAGESHGIPGDVNGDGKVDQQDLGIVLASYGLCLGQPGFIPAADIDMNGCVEQADLGILLANWTG